MAGKTIETLVVDLRARTQRLERDLDKANRSINRQMKRAGRSYADQIGSGFTKAFGRLAAVAGAAFGLNELRSGIIGVVTEGSQLQTTADKIGLTTTALQELRYAGEQFNIVQSATDMALQRFARRLGEADQGAGELRGTLEQYNIATRDSSGNVRATTDVLGDLADAIKNAGTEQEQLRIAFKAFDSEGAAFVNVLKQGSQGLAELTGQAHIFGQILEAEHIRRLNIAATRWTQLKGAAKNYFASLVGKGFELSDALGISGLDAQLEAIEKKMAGRKIATYGQGIQSGVKMIDVGPTEDELDRLRIKHDAVLQQMVTENRSAMISYDKELRRVEAMQSRFVEGTVEYRVLNTEAGRLRDRMQELRIEYGKLFQKYPEVSIFNERFKDSMQGQAQAMGVTVAELQKLESIVQANIPVTERYQEQIELLEKAIQTFPRRTEEFEKAIESIKEKMADLTSTKEVNEFRKIWNTAMNELPRTMAQSAARGELTMRNFLNNIAEEIMVAVYQKKLFEPLLNFIGLGSAGGGLLGGLFGKLGFADGGRPPVGVASVVGERGPELFVPDRPGTIVPNHAIQAATNASGSGGGHITINQTLNFNTDLAEVQRQIASAAPIIASATESQIRDHRARGRFR